MESSRVPFTRLPSGRPADAESRRLAEEEVPLGWECANPALQIERWRLEQAPASAQLPSSKS